MKQRTEVVNGREYKFQGIPVRHRVKFRDQAKNKHGVVNEEKYYELLMKHVVIEPKVDWEYFDEHDEDFEEVIKIAAEVANNKTPSDTE